MEKQTLFIILFLFSVGNIFSQFSLEKYLDEKFENYNSKRFSAMTDLTKKVVEEKLDSIPVKITLFVTTEGKVMKQVLENKASKKIKKLFDILFTAITKKYGKTQNEEELYGQEIAFGELRTAPFLLYPIQKLLLCLQ